MSGRVVVASLSVPDFGETEAQAAAANGHTDTGRDCVHDG
jgi:hypothetical protein